MHCNLKPTDAAPVVMGFNYGRSPRSNMQNQQLLRKEYLSIPRVFLVLSNILVCSKTRKNGSRLGQKSMPIYGLSDPTKLAIGWRNV